MKMIISMSLLMLTTLVAAETNPTFDRSVDEIEHRQVARMREVCETRRVGDDYVTIEGSCRLVRVYVDYSSDSNVGEDQSGPRNR